MSCIFSTGSADGLGQMAARLLVAQGHRVVLHASHPERAREAMQAVPGAAARDTGLQDRLIEACERLSGIRLPE